MKVRKRIRKIITITLLSLISYLFIFGILIFKIPYSKPSDLKYDSEEMLVKKEDQYASIAEEPQEALDLRLSLINEAKNCINIVYYMFESDRSGEIIGGLLLKKADEDVKINIIVDNKFFRKTTLFKTFIAHPNINVYRFERFSLLMPFTLHNSLHDKFITIDNKYSLIGGRNIGDRFYFPDSKMQTDDRDVLVFSKENDNDATLAMNEYTLELISSRYTKLMKTTMSYQENEYLSNYLNYFDDSYDFQKVINEAIAVDNITFVRSPLNRFNKEPVLFNTINDLASNSDNLIIQSPYITISKAMKKNFACADKDITFITNSVAINPNPFATSGYLRIRNKLALDYQVYESQRPIGDHAKSIIIGDDIAIIGSQNIDHRSFYLSTESAVVIYSKQFRDALNEKFDLIIADSLLVNSDGEYEINDNVEVAPLKKSKEIFLTLLSWLSSLFKEML